MAGASSQAYRRSNMTNVEKKRVLEEFDRRRTVEEDASMAERAFKEMILAVMPNQYTISMLCKNKLNDKDNDPPSKLKKRRKRKGCTQRSKTDSLTGLMSCMHVEFSFLAKYKREGHKDFENLTCQSS